MQKRAENEVLGHFLEFGTLDGLDIADCDKAKCSQHLVMIRGHA